MKAKIDNKKTTKFCLFLLAVTLMMVGISFAYEMPLSGGRLTSDFGPRDVEGKKTWHKGIDYAHTSGKEIKAVEGGNISRIRIVSSNNLPNKKLGYGNRIEIESGTRTYYYCHLYGGTYEASDGSKWELKTHNGKNIVVFYNTSGTVTKVLAAQSSLPVSYRGVSATADVTKGDYFARVGNTGYSTGPHLHLGLNNVFNNSKADNPFYLLPYSNGNSPAITLENPQPSTPIIVDGEVLLRARVETKNDYDLNKVRFYLSGSEKKLIRNFDYGGKEGESMVNADVVANETSDGVYPNVPNDLGDDKFIYKWDTNKTNSNGKEYPSGDYNLIIEAEDVKYTSGNKGFNKISVPIRIDNPPVVLSIAPAKESTNVSPTTSVIATFDKSMNASTFTSSAVYLEKMSNGLHAGGRISYDDSQKKLTFSPSPLLEDNTQYKFVIEGRFQGIKVSRHQGIRGKYA